MLPALPLPPSPTGSRDLGTSFCCRDQSYSTDEFFYYYYYYFLGKGLNFCFPMFLSFPVSYVFLCWGCSNIFTIYCIQMSVVGLCLTEELKKRRESVEGVGIAFASIHLEMEIAVLVIESAVSSGWTSCPGRGGKKGSIRRLFFYHAVCSEWWLLGNLF